AWGIGTGLAMAPSTEAITSTLPLEQQGVASALNDVPREFGSALGVALLGAVFTAGYHQTIAEKLNGVPVEIANEANKGIATAIAAADKVSPYSKIMVQAAQE